MAPRAVVYCNPSRSSRIDAVRKRAPNTLAGVDFQYSSSRFLTLADLPGKRDLSRLGEELAKGLRPDEPIHPAGGTRCPEDHAVDPAMILIWGHNTQFRIRRPKPASRLKLRARFRPNTRGGSLARRGLFSGFAYQPAQEPARGRRGRAGRLPLEPREVDAAAPVGADPLPLEKPFLLFEASSSGKGDSSAAVDHPVPRQTVLVRRCVQHAGNLPGSPVVAGERGDLGVGRDPASRNRPD